MSLAEGGVTVPHEDVLATLGDGELTLTATRLWYRGRGLRKHAAWWVPLDKIETMRCGASVWLGLNLWAIGFVGALAAVGMLLLMGQRGNMVGATLMVMAMSLSPLMLVCFGQRLRITTARTTYRITVPRRARGQVVGFMRAVEEAIPGAEAATEAKRRQAADTGRTVSAFSG